MEVAVKVRAVIVQNNQVLLVEFDDETGLHYNLPGGTVEVNEFLEDALVREVQEETKALVFIERLMLTHDYIPAISPDAYGETRILTLVYQCSLLPNSPTPAMPDYPDENQTAVRWIDVDKLHTVWLLPEIVDDIWAALR
ncbi:MAG: NUDIX domain-containing protein [Anaerolineae bacterium]|nr:NUDIX domain-containing protein [Anaerolineae bacterium]MCA9889340.1 NUDIX domain-containing protein [Anaerolineae bacterium]MCA9893431.1 NUDIX domain-containing protein [Anaerolineae bacterium]MCB9461935.1 NUDIX domain-containing protein [Anaerolineaceae bacterium]